MIEIVAFANDQHLCVLAQPLSTTLMPPVSSTQTPIIPIRFVWMYEECTESTAAGLTYQLIRNYAVVAANERNDCTIGFKDVVDSWNASDINFTIDNIKARSRIVLLCLMILSSKENLFSNSTMLVFKMR
uniref:Uncharacterized protein n=1 Tax=Ditylenchus dipsaci TaxID=166011 RepID=A0A915ECS6_9BILA